MDGVGGREGGREGGTVVEYQCRLLTVGSFIFRPRLQATFTIESTSEPNRVDYGPVPCPASFGHWTVSAATNLSHLTCFQTRCSRPSADRASTASGEGRQIDPPTSTATTDQTRAPAPIPLCIARSCHCPIVIYWMNDLDQLLYAATNQPVGRLITAR